MKTSDTAFEISKTILQQLGGNHFLVMTGSKHLLYGTADNHQDYLQMTLVKNRSRANRLTIYYDVGLDAYNMHFERFTPSRWNSKKLTVSAPKLEPIRTYSGIYCDQLQELFTETTGLLTRLF